MFSLKRTEELMFHTVLQFSKKMNVVINRKTNG